MIKVVHYILYLYISGQANLFPAGTKTSLGRPWDKGTYQRDVPGTSRGPKNETLFVPRTPAGRWMFQFIEGRPWDVLGNSHFSLETSGGRPF